MTQMCLFFGALMLHRWELMTLCVAVKPVCGSTPAERKTSCLANLSFFVIQSKVSQFRVPWILLFGRGELWLTGLILTFGPNSFFRAFANNVLLSCKC